VAARLVGLLSDPAAAAAMGERGREWVTREWSWEAAVERLMRLF